MNGARSRPTVLVRWAGGELRLPLGAGQSVREVLDASTVRVRAACGGTGQCGACSVRLMGGAANPPTLAERQKLTPEERGAGARLACQLRPTEDIEVYVDGPAPESPWRAIPREDLAPVSTGPVSAEGGRLGVAVDLGTTHLRVSLWDLHRGRRIATRRGPNPQQTFGADVLNRLGHALVSPTRSAELSNLVCASVVGALRDIVARDLGEGARAFAEIGDVVVVGNTAMLTLLTERGAAALLQPENWLSAVECAPVDLRAWRARWPMPNARLVLPGPIAGFIGSDLLAALVATSLPRGPPGSLLLDIGTNTELALWDGQTVHATSVPGGPAFEGAGVRFGMAAEPGAIYQVEAAAAGAPPSLRTVGGGEARGYCGSGLVDALALLRGDGRLKPSGRFAVAPGPEGVRLDPDVPRTAIFGAGVDAYQRAKAAIAAAMATLLGEAGLGWGDLRRVCVCGTFGRTLNLRNAQATGLLPPVAPERFELHPEAALAGCELALRSTDPILGFDQVRDRVRPLNLGAHPGYDEGYVRHLRLEPIGGG